MTSASRASDRGASRSRKSSSPQLAKAMSSVHLELGRLGHWRRWGIVAALLGATGLGLTDDLRATALTGRFRVNQWDVALEGLNNVPIVVFILIPLFIALVTDMMIGDRRTAYAVLSLPRAGRTTWWRGKVLALLVLGQLYFLLVVGVFSAVGSILLNTGWKLSEYGATVPGDISTLAGGTKYYPPPPFPNAPLLGVLVEASYAAVATSVFAVCCFALAEFWPQRWMPLALDLAASFVFYRIPPMAAHPLMNLFWT